MLFPIERSHFGIPEGSNSVSSSFRDTIDNFIIRLEDAYKDRPYELRKHNAELRSHWILEATGTFFARSADLFTDYTVDRILQRIGIQWHSPSVHASRRSTDLVAAPPTGSLDGAGPAARHPASPLLLLSIYLATHSRRVSEAMVARGLLATLQRLFDEPVVGPRGARRTPAVSGASRNVMHELSHELLVRVARHVDLRDCTIKQELRDELVAASRALSTRAFGVQWWETIDEDVYAFRMRRDMAGAESGGGRGGLERSASRGRAL
ncbi:hypothetical protein PHLGIDRAFT_117667 [Phlebiopsis gigantea 11061_1 CR5-6]|uniref:Uncharacterized protein n=1 Tax=Phlebiopsis gigantea (strain 11061_1 CR5-6) TaxID=745531 RepID=A0A0C3NRU7_PHLG1|nr:hypothetical protein PHLGIDRAFT_117667 [Phlebiopsis gigantea 11061_1 CR5-6]